MLFRQIHDPSLAQYSYLIGCQRTKEAVVVDPERDIDRYIEAAAAEDLTITRVAETHIHADFLSGARDLGEATGATILLSDEGGEEWRYLWPESSSARVELLGDGDEFEVGQIHFRVVHTPGHTPEHLCFLVTDRGGGASEPMGLLSGDFLFVGDMGRPDLLESAAGEAGAMEPAAAKLWESTSRLEPWADHLQVWPAHGAGSACGKALGAVPISTLGYERRFNASLALAGSGRDAFVDGILEGQPEPPLYFGRMKRENRDGAPPTRSLGEVTGLDAGGLDTALEAEGTVVLDTRRDRQAHLDSHPAGAVWAPWGGADFLAMAGSYVEPEERIILLGEPDQSAAMSRALYRIGLDLVIGVVEPSALAEQRGSTIPSGDWELVRARMNDRGVEVLDVRRASEYDEGHVEGARNIAHTRLRARLDELDRGKQLLVHCRTGHRAAAAASFLEKEGFDVVHIGSAIMDWRPLASSAAG